MLSNMLCLYLQNITKLCFCFPLFVVSCLLDAL